MPVLKAKVITRADLRANPDKLFVFGDNMIGQGLAGQAFEMRGEPNAVGIPTKWRPTAARTAFFADEDLLIVRPIIEERFQRLIDHVKAGGTVVWPEAGIGTGYARLEQNAPAIMRMIQQNFAKLVAWAKSPSPANNHQGT